MFDTLIVRPIFNLLIGLYSVIPGADFGIALVIFTIFVRFLLYPLVKKQLHQTKAMRKIQPELKKLKAKSKGDKQLEAKQMMDLYKRHGVSPFRSIVILMIQLPIFIALFRVIQIFTTHRDQVAKFTYDFMENLEPIRRLIDDPDTFNQHMLGVVDLTHSAFSGGNVNLILVALALIAGATQYVMSKQTMPQTESDKTFGQIMTEAAEGKKHDQTEMNTLVMNKMIKIMPVFMVFIMVSVPGALALYYVVSNLVAVLQQRHILNQDEDELEQIADEPIKKSTTNSKKTTAKTREKTAKKANITRITAKDSSKKKRR